MLQIDETLIRYFEQTGSIETARRAALFHLSLEFAAAVRDGQNPASVLREMGVTDVPAVLTAMQRELRVPVTEPPDAQMRFLQEPADAFGTVGGRAFYMIADAGGIREVPAASCVESHLPKHRKPTKEELQRAIDKCRGV